MSENKESVRLNAVVKELNVGIQTLVEHLTQKGFTVENKPTTKITGEMYRVLLSSFQSDKKVNDDAKALIKPKVKKEEVTIQPTVKKETVVEEEDYDDGILIKTGLAPNVTKPIEPKKIEEPIVVEVKPEPIVVAEVKPEPVVEKPKAVESPKGVEAPKVVEVPKVAETPKVVETPKVEPVAEEKGGLKVLGKINLDDFNPKKKKKVEPAPVAKPAAPVTKTNKKVEHTKVEQPAKPKVEQKVTPVVKESAPKVEAKKVEPTVEATVKPVKTETPAVEVDDTKITEPNYEKLTGLKVMGKIQLPVDPPKKPQPVASSDDNANKKKRRRKNFVGGSDNLDIKKVEGSNPNPQNRGGYQGNNPRGPHTNNPAGGNRPGGGYQGNNPRGGGHTGGGANPGAPRPPFNKGGKGNFTPRNANPAEKAEITDKEIQDKLKATLARINGQQNIGHARSKIRKQKRDAAADKREEEAIELEGQKKIKVTEFVTANELSQLMDLPINNIISACMSLGLMVSINQRLDAETISIVAEEFGYEVDFVTTDLIETIEEEIDAEEDLVTRPPIVTVMGHVDHGKTSLLDYIRKASVIAGEAGGITQHVGAYEVTLANGKHVTFLDTPGHEAFTAMRARGASLTDIVIIVIAADDSVMPQTKEAISHSLAAGVPIVFAINKIDREAANPDRIREQLSAMDILVEEWGGKYQCQEISAKKGLNIDSLLEKVLLESEMLNLKANPDKRAVGSVIEASLDKGRGITATIMVQSGTLKIGDPILAGTHSGKVKAMFDERGKKMTSAGPSTPVVLLGFDGAPQAGDKFLVTKSEQEAKEISNKRSQLQREQGIRTQKHITLDEIGRRLAIGNFKELKVIVKGDVDGSVEALSDSLIKLSTEEVAVSVIYKGVGQISESDVLLASASDAIVIGFQVRPSSQARKLAETEAIDIRLYSIIYDAIAEIKDAMEGMLAPKQVEKITGNVEIREVFKITKVGTIAGCYVTDGKIFRNSKIRIIRDGVVVYTGELASLKRFKDDVKEVAYGYECGLNINNFNDIREGDNVEAYEIVEVKRTLK
ncbi:MAG: translation initiation factor IF-2 [Bacteroidia bacterium]|nr:translation initiation factor IF-2 [Bacteroidia bacterium]